MKKSTRFIALLLAVRLAAFNMKQLQRITDVDNMSFGDLGEKKMAIFAVIPDNDTSLSYLVGMLYTQIIQELYFRADHIHYGALPMHVRFVLDEFANVSLPEEFDKSLATMRSRNMSATIIVQNLAQLKGLYKDGAWETITGNCDSLVYLGGNEQSTHEYVVTDNWRGHRMGLPVMIMLYAGLRRGEMLALQWEDVDIDKKLIHVTKSLCFLKNTSTIKAPKTKAGTRCVPIPNVLLAPLIEAKKTSGTICPSVEGEPMTYTAYKRAWDSYMNYLNVCAGGFISDCKQRPRIQKMEPFTAHMLRHTYATMLFDANVDVKSAQKFLGHSSVEVTLSIYTHLTQFKEDAAIEALNEHLESIG